MLEKVQGTTRQASQNQTKLITSSTQGETSILQPTIKLWYHAPKLVAEALISTSSTDSFFSPPYQKYICLLGKIVNTNAQTNKVKIQY